MVTSWEWGVGNIKRQGAASEILKNIPLLLGGIFLIYLAVVDETLFTAITMGGLHNRVLVTIATTLAAGVPMFFAVGLFKKSILVGQETIYYYEELLKRKSFWILTIVLLAIITFLVLLQGRAATIQGIVAVVGSVSLSIYLVIYIRKI